MLMPGLFGLRADEVVGKPIIEILGETEAEAMLKRSTTERPRDFRIWNDRRDQQQHALDPPWTKTVEEDADWYLGSGGVLRVHSTARSLVFT